MDNKSWLQWCPLVLNCLYSKLTLYSSFTKSTSVALAAKFINNQLSYLCVVRAGDPDREKIYKIFRFLYLVEKIF